MIFHSRAITQQCDVIHNFGIKNLIVSGCSFTHSKPRRVAWPTYLRDLGGFDHVYDTAMPGAGNAHIANSLQWALELDQITPAESLVIVMWSGNDRDDYLCPESNINGYLDHFQYDPQVYSAITGGQHSPGNTVEKFKEFTLTKSAKSRAIENYLYISGLWHYLTSNHYKFVFLDYINRSLPSRTADFDIGPFLPEQARTKLNSMVAKISTPYEWALKHDLLMEDDFHPSPAGHLGWTKNVLIPYLQTCIG